MPSTSGKELIRAKLRAAGFMHDPEALRGEPFYFTAECGDVISGRVIAFSFVAHSGTLCFTIDAKWYGDREIRSLNCLIRKGKWFLTFKRKGPSLQGRLQIHGREA